MNKQGKRLTVAQMKRLSANGIKNPDKYRLVKTILSDTNGNKHLSRDRDKSESWVIFNTETGEIIEKELRK
jgi:hypothetical protein